MSDILFGQFLLKKGLISPEILDQALKYQQDHNMPLGQLAVKEGLLSKEQILIIHEKQQTRDACFGEIARELKLLDTQELDRLLFLQNIRNIPLGEILLTQGHLSSKRFSALLEEYAGLKRQRTQAIESYLENYHYKEVLLPLTLAIQKLFLRFAQQDMEVTQINKMPEDSEQHFSFAVHLSLAKEISFYCSLYLITEQGDNTDNKNHILNILDKAKLAEILESYLYSSLQSYGHKQILCSMQFRDPLLKADEDIKLFLRGPQLSAVLYFSTYN